MGRPCPTGGPGDNWTFVGPFFARNVVRSAAQTVKMGMMIRRRHRPVPREGTPGPAPPRIGSAVARFVLGSLVAMVVVVVGGYIALRDIATSQAEETTAQIAEVNGRLVQTALDDGLLKRDPKAIRKMDDFVVSTVLPPSAVKNSAPIKRVKIWSQDGTVLYSDVPELIGKKYTLGAEERELLEKGAGAEAEISDLAKPENRYERQYGKLLEAHTPIRTPDGTRVLFEIYQQFSSIQSRATSLLRELAIPLLAGLAVLLLSQVPLAWSMARRLQRGHRDREALLANAIEASAQERRRIASDLHDGVVQDVAGVAFGLAPLAEDAERRGDTRAAGALRGSMSTLRQGVRDLRTLLVEIHPPSLESAGLEAALSDLLSPLQADGIRTELHVDDRATVGSNGDALVYRVAREALRNAQKYAEADSVRIDVTRPEPDTTRLVVTDDGRGFSSDDRARRAEEGHVGLTLLESLVRQSNGTLAVKSVPGHGTTVELEVPVR
jgi:two-component system, NarL family, sensor kinase